MAIVSKSGPADTRVARVYNRIRRRLGVIDFLLSLGLLVVLLATGWTGVLRDIAYRGAGQRYALAVSFFLLMLAALSKALRIGLDYYSYRLEHRYNLSNQKFRSWVWDQTKGSLIALMIGTVLVELLYFIMRQTPQFWWLIAWAGAVGFFLLLAQIAPVVLFPIFYKFQPLQNQALRDRLVQLSERAGTHVRGVYEWKLSEKSKKANAALAGLGSTRRILLADTLLSNYSEDEIEAILAHELGHHVHKHMLWSMVVQAGITLVGFWASAAALRHAVEQHHMFQSISDFANLPLLAVISTVISFVLVPALNAWSRRNERQADRYCFEAIPNVVPFISSMNKLADQNLAERNPSRFVEWFFHSHPPISKRIAAAEAYAASQKQTVAD
ncbi:MAG: M48 family metallopeptidase [Terriglobales bacterium]